MAPARRSGPSTDARGASVTPATATPLTPVSDASSDRTAAAAILSASIPSRTQRSHGSP
jgi:hypothetical protein